MTAGSPDIPTAANPTPPKIGRTFGLDNRFLAPILITCILLVGDLYYGVLQNYWYTAAAIVSSILLDIALGLWATGRVPHLASAYISGISVGILIRALTPWPYILCSALAISSKYVLRINGRHLWNPSNLGISVLVILIPDSVATLSQQWGNEIWVLLVIWLLGCMILYRLRRLHITLTYVAAFFALSFVRSLYDNESWINEIAPITAPVYQLYIFFMITDPKTTTRTRGRQCAVAVLVAVVETLLRFKREYAGIHAPYFALFIVFPVANLVEMWWDARRAKKDAGCETATKPAILPQESAITAASPNP